MLKVHRPDLEERVANLRQKIEEHQASAQAELQTLLNASYQQIINYFVPRVVDNPPDRMRGQFTHCGPDEARSWLGFELNKVFPRASSILSRITLEEQYKDMTYETLKDENFLMSVKKAYPLEDWDKAYKEFQAAGPPASHPRDHTADAA